MKKKFLNLNLQRILIAGAHGHLRDTIRKGVALPLRRVSRNRLKFPYVVALEVTNQCPLKCVMCPRTQRRESPGSMSLDLSQKIIEECSKHITLVDLVFTGMGEPLIHPRILEMFQLAKDRGIPTVRVVTNACLLTEDKVRKILQDSALDQISISLDALTPETYEKVKGVPNFHTVQKNLENFLDQREKGGYWRPFLSLHILKMNETASEVDGFLRKWQPKLKKGDRILIKRYHTFAGQVDDRSVAPSGGEGLGSPCHQIRELLYITWDGDVMPCSMDVLKTMRIGSLLKSSLLEIWKSPERQEIRKIHLEGKYDSIPLCKECDRC